MSLSYRCAVIGNPIAHSLSPVIHQQFAKQFDIELIYEKILATESTFRHVVENFFTRGGLGLNITSPFKRLAFEMADIKTPAALKAGSANTLWYEENKMIADSTDGYGFDEALKSFGDCKQKRWLILGAGGVVGALLPVIYSLAPEAVTIANRRIHKAELYQRSYPAVNVCELSDLNIKPDMIINATAMDFNTQLFKSLNEAFNESYCMDLSYARKPTSFTALAKKNGAAKVIDGFAMLAHQGALSFYRWFGKQPDSSMIEKAL